MQWRVCSGSDPDARLLADRHYSRQTVGHHKFTPPGRTFVLKTKGAYWVTSWPFPEYVRHKWKGAWICSAFRNEIPLEERTPETRSSALILQAVQATQFHYGEAPDIGFLTFVDKEKTRPKKNPGFCFIKAGFRPVGTSEGGLVALILPKEKMPTPLSAIGETTVGEPLQQFSSNIIVQ